ncbi:unnamed protein product [Camellia sinensis]
MAGWTRLVTSLWMFLIFTILHPPFLLPPFPILLLTAQSPPPPPHPSPRSLDSLLQLYAFRSFPRRPITGISYSGNFTGIEISALRLRTGSLRIRGLYNFKEFSIPSGLFEQPHVDRLVLVYHNLGNWSSLYYPLPGFTFLSPVLGLLAYNGSDLSAKMVPELDIRALKNPIMIKFRDLKESPNDGLSLKKCVYFDLHGLVEFNNVLDGNVCLGTEQGHFSIAVESTAPPPPPPPPPRGGGGRYMKHNYDKMWIIGGFVLMVLLLGMLMMCLMNYRHRKRVQRLEEGAERSVRLGMMSVGRSKMPMAMVTRTRPVLEGEHAP